ncbi:alginate lyase family protein [Cesiribacter sp. SM1]|uniref:alginate lyase family protein n=1 Tax=Cesiribacter sp. SM1 TaxID=2861196 RepID=UPI001CD791E2|nr:alginate lyase family protein [Cesiribacter sp. SM1]
MLLAIVLVLGAGSGAGNRQNWDKRAVVEVLREQVLTDAAWALSQEPVTVTASIAARSAGGKHDFYSEGDYWWPDPDNPEGPYIQRDGMTNPDNFVAHRLAMIRFSRIVGALVSAYTLTGEQQYVNHARKHLRAWFIEADNRMNPSLLYAQAIKGRVTGRGIGIIDTIHLVEVAQGVRVLEAAPGMPREEVAAIKDWFAQYLGWLTTHPYGQAEMNWKNNHATCWVMQVAAFARLTGNQEILEFCRKRFKEVLLPKQMAPDGSFPLELARTKPYGYSLFNLDAMTMVVFLLSDQNHNLWNYQTPDGKSIRKGIEFLYPYVKNKGSWPYQEDVMYWDQWPVAHPFLLFGAQAYKQDAWFETWKGLEHAPEEDEVIRNLPIRYPLIWLN